MPLSDFPRYPLIFGAHGGVPYAIPAGASDHRLGGLGFASWAEEVAEQEAQLGVFFYAHLGGEPALSAYGGLFC